MTLEETQYWNDNTNQQAALAYAVANNMINAEDTGLTEAELSGSVEYKGTGSEKAQIPVFVDRVFNGSAMSGSAEENETLEMVATSKTPKAEAGSGKVADGDKAKGK